MAELHLDERFNTGREVIGKGLAIGQKKVSYAFTTLWADIEVIRETQRKKNEAETTPAAVDSGAPVQAASARASAYISSWGTWASEKRKTGWGRASASDVPPT